MSWVPIVPAVTPTKAALISPVTFACIAAGGRYRQVCSLVVRPNLLEGGLPFWTIGQRVRAALGAGEHAGLLRITPEPSGPFAIGSTGGRKRTMTALLRVPAFPGQSTDAHKAQPVEYDWSDTWLEITLPAWTRPPGEISPATPAPQPVASAGRIAHPGEISPRSPVRVAAGVPVPTKANPFAVRKVSNV